MRDMLSVMNLTKGLKITRPFAVRLAALAVVAALVLIASWWYRGPYSDSRKGTFGNCPIGYTQYGVPLGCVSNKEYGRCQSGGGCPICLSNMTEIDTQVGRKAVTALRRGDLVWSIDGWGRRVLVPIDMTSRRAVPAATMLLAVGLRDGRSLYVSPSHPMASGRLFSALTVGYELDGSVVASIKAKPYFGGYTYDLLPRSASGEYWANGILVGSTLKR